MFRKLGVVKFLEDSSLFLTCKKLLEGIRPKHPFHLFNLANFGIEAFNFGLPWLIFLF